MAKITELDSLEDIKEIKILEVPRSRIEYGIRVKFNTIWSFMYKF